MFCNLAFARIIKKKRSKVNVKGLYIITPYGLPLQLNVSLKLRDEVVYFVLFLTFTYLSNN